MRISDWSSDVCSSDLVIHEALSFREVRRSWTVFNAKPLIFPDDPARTPRHLGDLVRPKMLDDLVERAGHGIERRKLLDHPIPCCQGRFALDRVALRLEGRARAQIAFIIRVRLIKQ